MLEQLLDKVVFKLYRESLKSYTNIYCTELLLLKIPIISFHSLALSNFTNNIKIILIYLSFSHNHFKINSFF